MIRLRVDDESLHTMRLAFSPLWETIGSLGILARYRGEAPSPYANWARTVRDTTPAKLTAELVEALRAPQPSLIVPAALPVPDPTRNTITVELSRLVETSGGDPGVRRAVTLLKRYWDHAVAPYWASIRSSLEDEILLRGRTLAVEGPEAMLHEIGGRVLWSNPLLTAPYHRDLASNLTRSRLLLVPTVFAGGLRLFVEHDDRVAMSYQARAAGYFHVLTARSVSREAEDRLALLLGRARAQVVRVLVEPRTTTAVAQALGLAKSTVSQHLAVLTDAGFVWKQRLGGRVFYQLDRNGLALLRQLGL
ncbi:helix-turn-helix transcriptional regulator [Micromonospora sp. Llam7]|uniref:ArsR/SmtB family transcription factor n=1 Tax=Micromonospora tarapacensis TaxID=2835305 RepID=UPI001C82AC0B|nr:helix-turn-helix domain-containing protein [Micromonospora tarapacensis]MBX7269074.1 helix-turn-helix transcriptional regulator [Micromonospora tarapacensis]